MALQALLLSVAKKSIASLAKKAITSYVSKKGVADALKLSAKTRRLINTVSDVTKPMTYVEKAREQLKASGYGEWLDIFDATRTAYSTLKDPSAAIKRQLTSVAKEYGMKSTPSADRAALKATEYMLKQVNRSLGESQKEYEKRLRTLKAEYKQAVKERRDQGFNISRADVAAVNKWFENASTSQYSVRKARAIISQLNNTSQLEPRKRATVTAKETQANRRALSDMIRGDMKNHLFAEESIPVSLYQGMLYQNGRPTALAKEIVKRHQDATGETVRPGTILLKLKEFEKYFTDEELSEYALNLPDSKKETLINYLNDPSHPVTEAEKIKIVDARRRAGFNRFVADMRRLGFNDVTERDYEAMVRIHNHPAWKKWQEQRYKLPYSRDSYARLARLNKLKTFDLEEYAALLNTTGSIELANELYVDHHPELNDIIMR